MGWKAGARRLWRWRSSRRKLALDGGVALVVGDTADPVSPCRVPVELDALLARRGNRPIPHPLALAADDGFWNAKAKAVLDVGSGELPVGAEPSSAAFWLGKGRTFWNPLKGFFWRWNFFRFFRKNNYTRTRGFVVFGRFWR